RAGHGARQYRRPDLRERGRPRARSAAAPDPRGRRAARGERRSLRTRDELRVQPAACGGGALHLKLKRIALLALGITALAVALYVLYLDLLVTHQFEGRRWTPRRSSSTRAWHSRRQSSRGSCSAWATGAPQRSTARGLTASRASASTWRSGRSASPTRRAPPRSSASSRARRGSRVCATAPDRRCPCCGSSRC